uniref:Protein Vpu n=1 Tax=Human immunodeficiency virus type 1 TaxID=11676 RepID=Q7SUZ6_HV1|nr:Vpu protein [Human immunodeficiency virus 1]
MQALIIWAIVALVVAAIIAIVVWTIAFIEYRKLLKLVKEIERLIDRIRERAEDSGNESDGDQEELSAFMEMGHDAPWNVDDL